MERNKLVAVAAGALVVGLLAGMVLGGGILARTEDEYFTLRSQSGSTCAFDLKQDGYVNTGNNLKLRFVNHCSSEVTVAMGNVRATQDPSAANCSSATAGGTTWPFKEADSEEPKRTVTVPAGGHQSFTLHGARNAGTYYFDVCLNGTRVDPRLVVE